MQSKEGPRAAASLHYCFCRTGRFTYTILQYKIIARMLPLEQKSWVAMPGSLVVYRIIWCRRWGGGGRGRGGRRDLTFVQNPSHNS